ncbi:hypothetical protein [Corynebacterium gerontici]|uniref:DUF1902 domain-containing protein n=1 Tax=Corynebacterium gerontici TaxID=2079234 RepID=A0A3G6IYZ4_9CORY|nr:hypothetical protein [Corynebacterium gerontici]AZA10723.1 hypothetical protein CGERO_01950 [Corynebacterium gerontici]
MRTFVVVAQRGAQDVWVLECPALGAVSQVQDLDRATEEMREPISYLSSLDQSASGSRCAKSPQPA